MSDQSTETAVGTRVIVPLQDIELCIKDAECEARRTHRTWFVVGLSWRDYVSLGITDDKRVIKFGRILATVTHDNTVRHFDPPNVRTERARPARKSHEQRKSIETETRA
jgi:hypothetical protein